jgi:hypothetical protein
MARLTTPDVIFTEQRLSKINKLEEQYDELINRMIDNREDRTTENLAELRHMECQLAAMEDKSIGNDVFEMNISIVKY